MTNQFEHNGITFTYDLIGEGRPLAFCHGLGGDRQQPRELLGQLDGYQILVWDCRGHGETRPLGPADKLNFASMAEDLAALLDCLRWDRAIVGGISMGAGIAARLAAQRPERVEALVLVRPAWLVQPMPDNLALFPRVAELLRQFGPERGLAEFQQLPELAAIRRESPAVADSLCEQFLAVQAVERSARLERMPGDCPLNNWAPVETLPMPALVVGNASDAAHPLEFASVWADHLPHARLVQIPSKSEDAAAHVAEFRHHLNRFLAER
jgi:pimeloyl-ACP methyl ester carboxylesterase